MKIIENIMAWVVLAFLLFIVFTIGHALTKGVAMANRLEEGYDRNYQLDIVARKCVHTGYGPHRSSEKVFLCEGRTMMRGSGGFMEEVK